jgi:hypothetical protein
MAAAVQAHAQVIVTSNLKHFLVELLAPYEIDVQSPDDFLVHQFHLNPDRMLDILDTQASASRQRRADILHRYKQTRVLSARLRKDK